jgi:hypothetical protein
MIRVAVSGGVGEEQYPSTDTDTTTTLELRAGLV